MKTKRTYFTTIRLNDGKYVDVIYESTSRRGTEPHWMDLSFALDKLGNDVDWNDKYMRDTATFSYILNDKNMEEQCFGEHVVFDLR